MQQQLLTMEKDKVFFGTEGITNTSANHIANLAKELYQSWENELSSIKFYDETMNLIGSNESSILSKGTTSLESISSRIEEIAQCKALIAYLREAIKARGCLQQEIRNLDLTEYCELKSLELPKEPKKIEPLTENDYYGSLGIKERNAFYTLEAQCATLGKMIHPKGAIATARETLIQKMNTPCEATGMGRDTILYHYTPTVELSKVEEMFFSLQNKYRELQAQLNSMKYECQLAVEKSTSECNAKYTAAWQEYSVKVAALTKEMAQYKQDEEQKLGKLKIIIPDKLKPIYTIVSNLGKK